LPGVSSAPAANKSSHWVNADIPKTPYAWLKGAEEVPGSWWPDWAKWAARRAGPKVKARTPGAGKLKGLEDAPGSYVMVKARN